MTLYKLTPLEVSCPVCYGVRAHLLYSVNSEQAAHHIFGRKRDEGQFLQLKSHIETLWQGNQCDFVRCDQCSFCFANPFVPGDSRFYELAYSTESGYASWKWEFQETLLALQNTVNAGHLNGFRLLEVGAGKGAFVKRVAPALTSKENVLCTEYSKIGASEISNYGIQCLSQDARDLDISVYQGYFDVICMFQVLEHMDGLDALFDQLTRISKVQAHLFIAVPNSKQREFFDLHGVQEDNPPTHIGRWNKTSFDVIANRYGWSIVRHAIEPQSITSKLTRFVLFRSARSKPMNLLDQIKLRPLRRFSKMMLVGAFIFDSLPAIIGLATGDLGVAQWVHLQKCRV